MAGVLTMRTDKNSDHCWLRPWLEWLDRVQILAGCNAFPEDPQLEQLHGWFAAGLTPADAVAQLGTLKARH